MLRISIATPLSAENTLPHGNRQLSLHIEGSGDLANDERHEGCRKVCCEGPMKRHGHTLILVAPGVPVAAHSVELRVDFSPEFPATDQNSHTTSTSEIRLVFSAVDQNDRSAPNPASCGFCGRRQWIHRPQFSKLYALRLDSAQNRGCRRRERVAQFAVSAGNF